MDRQGSVKDSAAGSRAFHGAGQPARERNKGRFAGRREQQQPADQQSIAFGQHGFTHRPVALAGDTVEIARPRKMMQRQRRDQKCSVGNSINRPDTLAIRDRTWSVMEERDQQRR